MVSHGIQALIALIVLVTISTIFVGLRLYLRWCQHGVLGASDIVVCLTLVCFIAYVVIDSQLLLDEEIWPKNPSFGDFLLMYLTLGPKKLEWILQVLFLLTFPYYTSLWGVKLTLILFYYSITPVSKPFMKLRWMLHATTFLTVATWLGFVLINVFWCFPVQRNWDVLDKLPGGLCIAASNRYTPYKYTVAAHLTTDIIIFCIPFPIIKRLKLPRRKFIAVSSVFLLAVLNIAVTIIRIVAITRLAPASVITVITGLEQALGIIVVCCPAFKGLVGRWVSSWRCHHRGGRGHRDHEGSLDFRDIGSSQSKASISASQKHLTSQATTALSQFTRSNSFIAMTNEQSGIQSFATTTTAALYAPLVTPTQLSSFPMPSPMRARMSSMSAPQQRTEEKGQDIQMETFFMDTINDDGRDSSDRSSISRSLEEEPEVVSPLGPRERADSDTISHLPLPASGGSSPVRLSYASTGRREKPPSPLAIPLNLSPFPDRAVSPKSSPIPSQSPTIGSSSQSSSPLVTPTQLSSFPMPSPMRARMSSMSSGVMPSPTRLDRLSSFPMQNSNNRASASSASGRRYSNAAGGPRRGSTSHVLV